MWSFPLSTVVPSAAVTRTLRRSLMLTRSTSGRSPTTAALSGAREGWPSAGLTTTGTPSYSEDIMVDTVPLRTPESIWDPVRKETATATAQTVRTSLPR